MLWKGYLNPHWMSELGGLIRSTYPPFADGDREIQKLVSHLATEPDQNPGKLGLRPGFLLHLLSFSGASLPAPASSFLLAPPAPAAWRAQPPLLWLPLPAEAQPGSAFLTPTSFLLPPGKKRTFKPHYLAKYKPQGEKGFVFVFSQSVS